MYALTLDLNGKSSFSVLALYKHFRINDANRSTNDPASRHATQTETKRTQLRNHRNFKKKYEVRAERGDANRGISA